MLGANLGLLLYGEVSVMCFLLSVSISGDSASDFLDMKILIGSVA